MMVTYRHKILLHDLKNRFKREDIENIKLILLFLGVFAMAFFFAFRILNTVNDGIETQKRTDLVSNQVAELEKENQILKSEKDSAFSDSESEAQYRALGFKKPGETIYIVTKKAPTPQVENTNTQTQEQLEQKTQNENWEKWILKLFK